MTRSLRGAVLAVAGLLLVAGVVALAALWYDAAHDDEFLPGVTVGHVAAGGRPVAAVMRALDAELPPVGETALRIVAGDRDATVTLAELGLRSDAEATLARARTEAERMGLPRRIWHRLLDKPVARSYDVLFQVDRDAVRHHVADLAAQVALAPVDARIDTSSGMVAVVPAAEGRALDVTATTARVFELAGRVANGAAAPAAVEAPITALAPKITGFTDVILVRTAENKLYHYDHGTLVKTYSVATGSSRYPTPKGSFSVVLKRRNPVWVNPDPGGWGKSLPARIGPGPRNPLGTRAMNLDVSGIRIHGTANVASLGHSASHGCIRMAMPDVEELFDQVDQGTPVAIIEGPPPPPPAAGAPAGPAAPAPTAGAAVPVVGDPNSPVDLEAG